MTIEISYVQLHVISLLTFFCLKSIFTILSLQRLTALWKNSYINAFVHKRYTNAVVFLRNYQHYI